MYESEILHQILETQKRIKIIVQLNGRATVQQIERWRLQVRARIPENTPSEEDILSAKEER